MCAYVITSWHASNEPVDGQLVAITGRNEGLVSWLLTRLEISPTVGLELSPEQLTVHEGSLSGRLHRIVPVENICATVHGCHRPWRVAAGILLTAVMLGYALMGSRQWLLSLLVVVGGTVIAGAYYVLNRALTLGFVETSGHVTSLRFRIATVAGMAVDEDSVAYVATVTQALIDNRKSALAAGQP